MRNGDELLRPRIECQRLSTITSEPVLVLQTNNILISDSEYYLRLASKSHEVHYRILRCPKRIEEIMEVGRNGDCDLGMLGPVGGVSYPIAAEFLRREKSSLHCV